MSLKDLQRIGLLTGSSVALLGACMSQSGESNPPAASKRAPAAMPPIMPSLAMTVSPFPWAAPCNRREGYQP
jgi:hypothetical protein